MPSRLTFDPNTWANTRLRALLRPAAAWLASRGVTADQAWLAVPVVAAVAGGLLLLAPTALWLLPLALAARWLMSLTADLLAATQTPVSPRGVLYRAVGGVLADAMLYLPLALHPSVTGGLIVALVVLGIAAEVAALAAQTLGGDCARLGPLRVGDRALLFGLIALILLVDPRAGTWLSWLILPALGLAAATVYNRVRSVAGAVPALPDA